MRIVYVWDENDVEPGRRVFDKKNNEFIIGWRDHGRSQGWHLVDLSDGMTFTFTGNQKRALAAHLTKYDYTPLKTVEINALATLNRHDSKVP